MVAVLSDPKAMRRMLLAAKIIGPAVAAGALRASTGVRGVLDERRARQLGVPIEDVADYRGAGGYRAGPDRRTAATPCATCGRDAAPTRRSPSSWTGHHARLGELSAAAAATASMPVADPPIGPAGRVRRTWTTSMRS